MAVNDTENGTIYPGLLTELKGGVREYYYLALGLMWLNVVLIISLNIAVIVTILRYKKKSRLYFLLMNMAIADLTTGLIDALVNSLERTFGMEPLGFMWFGGDAGVAFCKIQRTASNISLLASNFILAVTSVDRALVVAKPMLNFKRGFMLQKILILGCWLLSTIINSPLLKYMTSSKTAWSKVVNVNGKWHNWYPGDKYYHKCGLHLEQHLLMSGYQTMVILMLVFMGLIPLFVIIVSYSVLVFAIYKRARSPPNNVRGIDNLRIGLVINKGLPSSKARSIKLTFGIVLAFIVSWTPFFVAAWLGTFKGFDKPVSIPLMTCYYWACVINPIVFFVFHRQRNSVPQYSYSSDTPLSKTTSIPDSARNTPIRHIDENLPMINLPKNKEQDTNA